MFLKLKKQFSIQNFCSSQLPIFKILEFIQTTIQWSSNSHTVPPKAGCQCWWSTSATGGFGSESEVLGLRQAARNSACVSSDLQNNSARTPFFFLQIMTLWFQVVRSLVQGHLTKAWPRWNEKIKGLTGHGEHSLISEVCSVE